MSHNDEYNSASLEAPSEKMAALQEELAREDAEKINEEKYAPKEKPSSSHAKHEEKSNVSEEPDEESVEEEVSSKKKPATSRRKELEQTEGDDDDVIEEIIEEEEEGKPQVSSLVWNIAIVAVIFLVGGMGYMYWQQMQTMPKTPLENAMEDYKVLKKKYAEHKMESFEVQKRQIANDIYLQKLEQIASLEETVELKKKKIEDLRREIMGVRGEIRAYYGLYKANTRKKARNLHFDSIMTVKTGKTYLDVFVQRVFDDYVSVVHAGGAIRIAPDDLPEPIRERLAYGDPLGIAVMDEELRQQQKGDGREKANAVSVAIKMDDEARVYSQPDKKNATSASPSSSSANVPLNRSGARVSSADVEPPSGMPSVDTKTEQQPASNPEPSPSLSDPNWKPAPVPAPFLES